MPVSSPMAWKVSHQAASAPVYSACSAFVPHIRAAPKKHNCLLVAQAQGAVVHDVTAKRCCITLTGAWGLALCLVLLQVQECAGVQEVDVEGRLRGVQQ